MEFEEKEVNPPIPFRIFRFLVFWVGDTRKIAHFPWITWDVHEHKMDLNEVMLDALPLLEPGDIILHRDDGYLSNLFIGGAMIHAGVYVGGQQVVEAISEGVLKRHAGHILFSDRACILRPRLAPELKEKAVAEAIEWANKIVGFPYDILFDFNGKKEREMIEQHGKEAARKGVRFCCTEVPYFCYRSYMAELGIKRRRNVSAATHILSFLGMSPGRAVISADMYFTANFDLIWCSRHFTPAWCKKRRMPESARKVVEAYWDSKRALAAGNTPKT